MVSIITELLTFGTTLTDLVREKIKYSTNMRKEDQLFDGLTDSYFFIDSHKKLTELRNKEKRLALEKEISSRHIHCKEDQLRNILNRHHIKRILQSQVGNCGELCDIATQIACDVNIFDSQQGIYCSKLKFITADHEMLLLHQDHSIKFKDYAPEEQFYCNLEALAEKIDNAVIVDPWIYQVTPLAHYQKHIQAAAQYNAHWHYQGIIRFLCSFLLGNDKDNQSANSNSNSNSTPPSESDPILEEMVREFKGVYEEYLSIISKMDNPQSLTGRTFFTARENLISDIKEKEKSKDN